MNHAISGNHPELHVIDEAEQPAGECGPEITILFFLNLSSHLSYRFFEIVPRLFRWAFDGQWLNPR
jgi:hypothetical protein